MDCLITKLKGSVENNNLPYFGCMLFDVENGAANGLQKVQILNGEVYRVLGGTINGERTLTQGSSAIDISSLTIVKDQDADKVQLVVPKYNLFRLVCNNTTVDLNELEFTNDEKPYLVKLQNSHVSLNLAPLNKCFEVDFQSSIFSGDNRDLTNLGINAPRLTKINFNGVDTVHGDLSNIGLSGAENITLFYLPLTESITFSVENFVAKRRSVGRTTGSMTSIVNLYACNATFNGARIEYSANYTLSWTASTITFQGVTIDA